MNMRPSSSFESLAWVLAACTLASGCHNRGNNPLGGFGLGPSAGGLGNHAAYVDVDRSGSVNVGDELWMRFDGSLALGPAAESAFELPVLGDGLGAPNVELSDDPSVVRIVLGQMPSLRTRGIHNGQTATLNLPSGLRVASDAPSGAIVSSTSGVDAVRGGLSLDIVPEFRRGAERTSDRFVTAADLDCDGDLDLVSVLPGQSETLKVELQGVDGSFSTQLQFGVGPVRGLALMDTDQDGLQDLVLLDFGGGRLRVYRNTSTGPGNIAFQDAHTQDLISFGPAQTITPIDSNRDGDPDLLIGTSQGLFLALGSETSSFEDASLTTAPVDSYTAVATGDLDGNGTEDAYAGGLAGEYVLLMDANGAIVETLERAEPAPGTSTPLDAHLVDLRNDGRRDVLIARAGGLEVWRNDPDAGLASQSIESIVTSPARRVLAVDLDGDFALDLVRMGANELEILGGDGLGSFTRSPRLMPLDNGTSMAIEDFDNDGDLDAVVSGDRSEWMYGSALGTFGSSTLVEEDVDAVDAEDVFPGIGQTLDVIHGDWDGDGDLDAVTSRVAPSGGEVRTWRNTGVGVMELAQVLSIGLDRAEALALADFDQDGDLDLFAASVGDSSHLWLADPEGIFPEQSTPVALGANGAGVGIGDVDNDGDLDIALGTVRNAPNRILLNGGQSGSLLGDGGGTGWNGFDGEFQFNNTQHANDFLLSDLDCDGDLDMVIAHGPGGQDTAWRNTLESGALGFEQVLLTALDNVTVPTVAVRTRDVNFDGRPDLILGARTGVRVLFGDGQLNTGSFVLGFVVPGGAVTAMDLGDVDGDGFSDLVVGADQGVPVRVFRGLPGSFANAPSQTPPFGGSPSSVSLGDRSGDGALDLLVGERVMVLPNVAFRNQ